MKNYLECESCNHKNPLFQYNCEQCHAFLRTKIANLNMSKFLLNLLESPTKAFVTLIQSEQKNFIYLILFFAALKLTQTSITLKFYITPDAQFSSQIVLQIFLSFLVFIGVIFLFSFVAKLLYSITEFRMRFKDIAATNIYSLTPLVIGILFLFPIEIALFGQYWITGNPSPFLLKETAAYTLWGIEGLFFLWAIVLSIISNFVQTRNIFFSLALGTGFIFLLVGISFFMPNF